MSTFYRIAVVGARRRRQGIGAFIAARFIELGHEVCAIVGASRDGLTSASDALKRDLGVKVRGYTEVEAMFAEQDVDVLVVASPDSTHLGYLEAAVQAAAGAGCHVFCEKPLWWPRDRVCPDSEAAARKTADLVERFDARRRTLFVNLQWPHTLSAFGALYPGSPPPAQDLERFEMRLSPESTGAQMVVDAAPHLLSMLHRLLGDGEVLNGVARYDGAGREALTLRFDYRHGHGETRVTLALKRHLGQPKPAGYSINGDCVERRIGMPDYLLSLASRDRCIPMDDPLKQSVEAFLNAVRRKSSNNKRALVSGMTQLCRLVRLSEQAGEQAGERRSGQAG